MCVEGEGALLPATISAPMVLLATILLEDIALTVADFGMEVVVFVWEACVIGCEVRVNEKK